MLQSGFVLAGGASSRMGRDKALLPYRGTTLVEHVAKAVLEAAGNVAIVGEPERYGVLGYPVYPDKLPGCGPLGGVYTALSVSATDWNLVVACDMPGVTAEALRVLLDRPARSDRNCIAALSSAGEPEPLCAVYHRQCLSVLERAIRDKQFKMRDLVRKLDLETRAVDTAALVNVNTPREWAEVKTR